MRDEVPISDNTADKMLRKQQKGRTVDAEWAERQARRKREKSQRASIDGRFLEMLGAIDSEVEGVELWKPVSAPRSLEDGISGLSAEADGQGRRLRVYITPLSLLYPQNDGTPPTQRDSVRFCLHNPGGGETNVVQITDVPHADRGSYDEDGKDTSRIGPVLHDRADDARWRANLDLPARQLRAALNDDTARAVAANFGVRIRS